MSINLVLVFSEGPMASSVVAGLIEMQGYIQLPFRKYGLASIDPDSIDGKSRFLESFKDKVGVLCRATVKGGVTAGDRNRSASIIRVDASVVWERLANYGQRLEAVRFSDFYANCRMIVAESLLYKEMPTHVRGHVELMTVSDLSDSLEGLKGLRSAFNDVKIIALDRNFVDWVESLASQRFENRRKWRNFYFNDLIQRYGSYHCLIGGFDEPTLKIQFDEVFLPNTDRLVGKISDFLDLGPEISANIENETLDLFGAVRPFTKAVTLADVPGKYFSSITRGAILAFMPKEEPENWMGYRAPRWQNALIYLLYLIELCRYHVLRILKD